MSRTYSSSYGSEKMGWFRSGFGCPGFGCCFTSLHGLVNGWNNGKWEWASRVWSITKRYVCMKLYLTSNVIVLVLGM